jgi:DNA modification methylase
MPYASENGGITNDSLLSDNKYKKRFSIPVLLGGASLFQPNPFKSSISTGNIYHDFSFFYVNHMILVKDSVAINDSTTEYLFYPKLRLQHSFTYSTYSYQFKDDKADSVVYHNWYDTIFKKSTIAFAIREKWTILSNDFSLLQLPDTKNAAQLFLAGITHQRLAADF